MPNVFGPRSGYFHLRRYSSVSLLVDEHNSISPRGRGGTLQVFLLRKLGPASTVYPKNISGIPKKNISNFSNPQKYIPILYIDHKKRPKCIEMIPKNSPVLRRPPPPKKKKKKISTKSSYPKNKMSQCMRFPTMWYVRPEKPQISLRICAV